jgi:inner membrane protein
MPSIFTHAAIPIALNSLLPRNSIASTVVLTATICSMAPDLDVVGFAFGIQYGDAFGHRGLTHSMAFAVVIALLATLMPWSRNYKRLPVFLFLFASTASHGILDSMTNGGLGVAFLAPFNSTRHFFRWRLIEVSPLGIDFFSETGAKAIFSEIKWIWCPYAFIITIRRLGRFRKNDE